MGFMDKDEIIEILKMVEASNVAEFHLQTGDLKISLKKHGTADANRVAEAVPELKARADVPAKREEERKDRASGSASPGVRDVPAPKEPPAAELEAEGLIPIQAPMLGTFYRSPKPDAPPFVEIGQFVTEEDVVCIIEVMKLFNTVKAGVRGRVAKICAENARLVEYKQVLFLVEEASAQEAEERHAS